MALTINDFWRNKLNVQRAKSFDSQPGWEVNQAPLDVFVEAPLSQSSEFGAGTPSKSDLILVSAPGAVGKSTLAKQIAATTGAIYIDLATAEPVGGNFLSGGLAKSGLYASWQAGTTAVLIDGLDEARLRVTQAAFTSFLGDVAQLSKGRPVPTVLFGRTGAVQETWLMLTERNLDPPVLEIGYYDRQRSIEFTLARVRTLKPDRRHEGPEHQAISLLLDRLRQSTSSDGDRFAGYAPVLMAVAERVAGDTNASALIAQIEAGDQPVTLEAVVDAILQRERSKLSSLELSTPDIDKTLYSPTEQLDRLSARIYGRPQPAIPEMSPNDAQIYGQALESWVPEHPFLDGGNSTSSAVFAARIAAHALQSDPFEKVARQAELSKGAAANPFLAGFYLALLPEQDRRAPPQHLGLLYSSLRATLALGDTATLQVEPVDEDAAEEEALLASVDISVDRKGSDRPISIELRSEQIGILQLGPHVEDVDINVPIGHVEVGLGTEATFVAPINIQCARLIIDADRVIVEAAAEDNPGTVYLECEQFSGAKITTVPTVREKSTLSVSWPDATAHPWTSFATTPLANLDPRVDEGLRRLRKFVIAFRSHSKGSLRRYRAKLDHARMTKGVGQTILDALLEEDIITIAGEMYVLDADALGAKIGATYSESMRRQFSSRTVEFVKDIIK